MRPNTVIDFWRRVRKGAPQECWPWLGATRGRLKFKYGIFWFNGKCYSAHRFAWMDTHGKLPRLPGADSRGTCVTQSCHFGLCCNPRHLSARTHKQNMEVKCAQQRDTMKHKKYCKHGHRRTPQNLYTSKKGLRACRTCHRIAERERQRRKKEQRLF